MLLVGSLALLKNSYKLNIINKDVDYIVDEITFNKMKKDALELNLRAEHC